MGEKEGKKKREKNGDGGKKEDRPITVLKVDMHCDGCAEKVMRSARHFDGVRDVKINMLTVVGVVDPEKLRKRIEFETKKKVVLVSPLPKKGKVGGGGGGGGGEKKGHGKEEDGPITVVLKVDMHSYCFAKEVMRIVEHFDGVRDVKINMLTVVGEVDPEKLRKRIECETKKKVVLVSPLPKKGKVDGGGSGGGQKADEPEVLKMKFQFACSCDGCIKKIEKIIYKTEGVQDVVAIDKETNLVTVKATMDTNSNSLLAILKEKLKRSVKRMPVVNINLRDNEVHYI